MPTNQRLSRTLAPAHAVAFPILPPESVAALGGGLRTLLADAFALYLQTKGLHWHVGGRHFRDYHRLLDEQASQVFEMTDVIAERARALGTPALRSLTELARHRSANDGAELDSLPACLAALCERNLALARSLRALHALCDQHSDIATASRVETWLEETEQRVWFLREILATDRDSLA